MASSVLGLNSNGSDDANGTLDAAEQRRQDEELVSKLRAGEEEGYETLIARFPPAPFAAGISG